MPTPSLQHEIGKKQPFEDPEVEVYLNLVRTHQVLSDALRLLFRDHQLSQSQYNVLRILHGHSPKGLPSQRIGEFMVVRDPDMTQLIDRLQKADLVSRHRCDEDRRRIIVRITAAGRSILKKLNPKVLALHKQQLGHLSPQQLKQLNRLLESARQAA